MTKLKNVLMNDSRKRDDEGKYTSDTKITGEDILDTMNPYEPYTTREIADELDVPRRTMYNYLQKLADKGDIRKKKTEPRSAIWVKEEME